MDNEKQTIMVMDDDGNEVECEVICTFQKEDDKRNFIVITDNIPDEDGVVGISAFYYPEDSDDDEEMTPVESDEDWELVEHVMDGLMNGEEE